MINIINMSRKLKGVSPLVAVIFLIGVTLIIAGFLANWATQFTTNQISKTQYCLDASVIIQGATYSDVDEQLNLYVDNSGDSDLTFYILLEYTNGTIAKDPSDDREVVGGGFETFTINNVWGSLKEVTIKSNECQGVQDFVSSRWITGL